MPWLGPREDGAVGGRGMGPNVPDLPQFPSVMVSGEQDFTG